MFLKDIFFKRPLSPYKSVVGMKERNYFVSMLLSKSTRLIPLSISSESSAIHNVGITHLLFVVLM